MIDYRAKQEIPSTSYLAHKVRKYITAKHWYSNSRQVIQEYFIDDWDLFIDILAATSPRLSVPINVRMAYKAYVLIKAGKGTGSVSFGICNKSVQRNLTRIRQGIQISGPKINPFAKALKGDEQAIVLDTWICAIFHIKRGWPTIREREYIETVIRSVARKTALTPAQAQACLWCYAKVELNNTHHNEHRDYGYYLSKI